jgi:hypothetical protein
MTPGDIIINAVVRAGAIDRAIMTGESTIFVWSTNAAEQIEAALREAGYELLPRLLSGDVDFSKVADPLHSTPVDGTELGTARVQHGCKTVTIYKARRFPDGTIEIWAEDKWMAPNQDDSVIFAPRS